MIGSNLSLISMYQPVKKAVNQTMTMQMICINQDLLINQAPN